MKSTIFYLFAWRPGKLAKGALRMTAGMGLRCCAQILVFFIVARLLGVSAYGAFAAASALAAVAAGFTGFGARSLLVRDTARQPEHFAVAWSGTLAAIVVSAPALFACYFLLALSVLPEQVPMMAIVLVGAAEVLLAPLALACVSAYQGHERIDQATRLVLVPALIRLCAALAMLPIALLLPTTAHLSTWAALYACAALVSAAYALARISGEFGPLPSPDWSRLWSRLVVGLPFAVNIVATKVYTDIDKVMIAKLASVESAGAYSAGHRIVDVALIPVASLLIASMPRIYRVGEGKNIESSAHYVTRVMPIPIVYAVLVGAVLFLLAGYAPLLLGEGFSETTFTIRWLAWLPAFFVGRLFLQQVMIGGDHQNLVVFVLVLGALLNILANLALIPTLGWRGAAISTFVAEVLMTLAMVRLIARRRPYDAGRTVK